MATNVFRDCIVSLVDLNNVGALLAERKGHGVRVMRDLHQLVADRAPMLKSHEDVCFFQASVLLVAFVNAREGSYARVMDDVAWLKSEFMVLTHEFAHELLHHGEDRPGSRDTRELEAEAVAFVVGHAIGLDVTDAARDYIQLYRGDSTRLAQSLDRIQRTASSVLAALEGSA